MLQHGAGKSQATPGLVVNTPGDRSHRRRRNTSASQRPGFRIHGRETAKLILRAYHSSHTYLSSGTCHPCKTVKVTPSRVVAVLHGLTPRDGRDDARVAIQDDRCGSPSAH
jgi:hypothetical protein